MSDKSHRILTESITRSDHPTDNLLCLKSMIGYIQFSISIASNDPYTISGCDAEGLAFILAIIEHDIGALAEIVELKK